MNEGLTSDWPDHGRWDLNGGCSAMDYCMHDVCGMTWAVRQLGTFGNIHDVNNPMYLG